MSTIDTSTFDFLKELRTHNNREWFTENKEKYQAAHQNMIGFMESLIEEMSKVDQIEDTSAKRSLFRIYRDVRFSKGKEPYKTHFAGRLARATQWLRGGYYIHIEPGNSFLAGGFFSPNPADLKLIRDELAHDAKPLKEILADEDFKNTWGTFKGEAVKSAPRGFEKDHPNIDLIRFKQFHVAHSIPDDIVLSEQLMFEIVKSFIVIRPFFDYMSEILTRNLEK